MESSVPVSDVDYMAHAVSAAASVRRVTSPNPWVGAVVVTRGGRLFVGATEPPGGRHAEIVALDASKAAGADVRGAELFVPLEPCVHHGRTGPCVDAILTAGIGRVVVGAVDPDSQVAGRGIERLRAAGVEVTVGVGAEAVATQLAPYLTHRRTGRPFVVLKLAATMDGGTAAPDGSSQWITGPEARADAHGLRAESDAVLVGAGTVRRDDPRLTVRHGVAGRQPMRVVLGHAPPDARVHPCVELSGPLAGVLDELGRRHVLQLLVEGGASVAAAFHGAGLVDQYVLYLAPALFGGDDARGLFAGPGVATITDLWRGRILGAVRLGGDLRVDLAAASSTPASPLGG
jgi:diaminohydroxyphosphoribosylaminopyrimidine deaminase/5-amino-6-(5-phosphoribosylamino)uracil reductase